MSEIHKTAIIADGAQIGQNVRIDPYAVIDGDVVIGDGCHIHSSVRIYSGAKLGNNVEVFPSTTIAAVPQDLKFGGERTSLFIDDNTVVREFVSLHRGTGEGGETRIGKNCLIMAYAHVAHDCLIGDNVILANSVNLAGHVEIEDFAILGGVLPVHQFVRIGRHCMVGGGFRVPKDVPPYIMAGGYPLAYAGLNAIGLRRRGFKREDIDSIKQAYKFLFASSMNTTQALKHISEHLDMTEPIRNILEFAKLSKRGLLPGRSRYSEDPQDV
ncbi:acyl-ACP--UDP-N-acetylglucosamine O-acyltransferase [bacterium]|nr:MAG: acyl-ACP--UDP-N-acetylglucosamine O-acyltransferase [bacterium]